MATLTITVLDEKVPDIIAAVGAYNAEHGTLLTIPQWAKRVLAAEVYSNEIRDAQINRLLQAEAAAKTQAAADEELLLTNL